MLPGQTSSCVINVKRNTRSRFLCYWRLLRLLLMLLKLRLNKQEFKLVSLCLWYTHELRLCAFAFINCHLTLEVDF